MGFPPPRFNIKLSEDETAETFVSLVEQEARAVAGDISDREYLARRVIAGAMPLLNRVSKSWIFITKIARFPRRY